MTFAVKVHGGTGAGSKKPLAEPAAAWTCSNGHENKGAWTRCLWAGCNEPRPKP